MLCIPAASEPRETGIERFGILAPAVTGTFVANPKPGSVSIKYSSLLTVSADTSFTNVSRFVTDQLPALSFDLMKRLCIPAASDPIETGIERFEILDAAVTGTFVANPKPGSESIKYSTLFTV